MDERLKESVSALMDDEANELELQRVLTSTDNELAATWHRYHQVRQVVRECDRDVMSIDIRGSLAQHINRGPSGDSVPKTSLSEPASAKAAAVRKSRFLPSMAIAASAVFALVFALQYPVDGVLPGAENRAPIAGTAPAASVVDDVRSPEVHVEFDERHAARFNEYLLRHAEHSAFGLSQGVMPLARVASVNSVGI